MRRRALGPVSPSTWHHLRSWGMNTQVQMKALWVRPLPASPWKNFKVCVMLVCHQQIPEAREPPGAGTGQFTARARHGA